MGLCYSLRTCVCLSFPMLWAFICLWGVRPQSVRLRWALETEFSFLAHTVVSIPGRESRICSVSTLCDSFEESADVDDNNANGPFKRMRRRKLERERERKGSEKYQTSDFFSCESPSQQQQPLGTNAMKRYFALKAHSHWTHRAVDSAVDCVNAEIGKFLFVSNMQPSTSDYHV